MKSYRSGLTLIEIVLAMGIVVILTAIVLVSVNPSKQLGSARNSQRWADVNSILSAAGQNIADNKGTFSCSSGSIPTSTTKMASSSPNYNIAPCLVSDYLPKLPYDPSASSSRYNSTSDYDTGYTILKNATTGRITITAPSAELSKSISVTR